MALDTNGSGYPVKVTGVTGCLNHWRMIKGCEAISINRNEDEEGAVDMNVG
jgi:hypothetical protein